MKERFSKILFWGSWWFMISGSFVLSTIISIPMTIYGLINGVTLKETVKGFWIEGFYKELKSQHENFKGMGL